MLNEFCDERNIQKEQRTPAQKVSHYIKTKLLYHELHPGDRIPTEDELCQTLNVSRTSVREALKSLAAINLITIRRGDGTYISDPDDISFSEAFMFKMLLRNSSMEELLTFREHIEMAVMQTAMVHITEHDMQALCDSLDRFDQCITKHPEDSNELHRLDIEFHTILGRATGNKLIEDIYSVALDLFSPTILQNYVYGQVKGPDAESTRRTHRITCEALKSKNVNMCAHAVWCTLDLWRRWMELRDKNPAPDSNNAEDNKFLDNR